jgi:predicted acyltransferase
MNNRNESLDALRGFAILTMVLSGAIAYGDVLPTWMFHAQVPPPEHKFNPAIPGITWVDLVFPFFLFSMGAAIPLSFKQQIEAGKSPLFLFILVAKRFFLLAFFALFTNHMKAWVISEQPGITEQLLSIFAFILLFFQFYDYKGTKFRIHFLATRIISFAIAFYLLWKLPFWGGKGFDWYHSDIIIMVLANMAFFGSLVYLSTVSKPLVRLGVLPFIMAVFLSAKEPSLSWSKSLFEFNHIGSFYFDWFYKFYFLKYLFIIIPGTLAGEWMLEEIELKKSGKQREELSTSNENKLAFFSLLLIIINLYGLFTRQLLFNFLATTAVCGVALLLIHKTQPDNLYRKKIQAGTYLLLLGLFFEAWEGGIKKDPSTYSYYFITSGLAFFSLVIFTVMDKRKYFSGMVRYFSLNGKNPMVAYVAGNLLLLPILVLTHVKPFWDGMNQNAFMGLLKGLLFTGIVSLITIFFVKRKWFWKT